MRALAHTRRGAGEPLVLLHGIGHRRQVWDPVLDALAEQHDVVAVDFPGFGESVALPPGDTPTPQRLADVVEEFATGLGMQRPHVAGISLGGFVALQLAATGRARTVTGVSPAGLWGPAGAPAYSRVVLRLLRATGRRLAPRADAACRTAAGRAVLGGLNYARPWRVPPAVLAEDIRRLGGAPGWDDTRAALEHGWLEGAAGLVGVPAQVAWGTRDLVLPRAQGLRRDLLPPSVRLVVLPGCGHSPTYDDPALVVRTLLQGTGACP